MTDTPTDDPAPGRKPPWRYLLAILLACAVQRVWLVSHTEVISRDGTIYITMAQRWLTEPARVVEEYDYHVGYPAVVAWTHSLLAWAGLVGGAAGWDLAGQVVSLLAGLAGLAGLWLFAGWTFSWRTAWVSTLLFGVGRKWADDSSDVISDALAVSLQVWGITLIVMATRQLQRHHRRGVLLAGVVGLLAGAGYLVRPEALLVTLLAVGAWLFCAWRRQIRWRLALSAAFAACAVTAACAAPYVLAVGALTKKKSLEDLVAVPRGSWGALAVARSDFGGAPVKLLSQLTEAISPALAVLAAIYLLTWAVKWARPAMVPADMPPRPRRLGAGLMVGATVVMSAVLMGLYQNVGYLSHRHVMFVAALVSPLAGAGLIVLVRGVEDALSRRGLGRWASWALPMATACVAVGLLLHGLEPLHGDQGYHRRAGEFVGSLATGGEGVLTDSRWTVHYARGRHGPVQIRFEPLDRWRYALLLQELRNGNVRYLAIQSESKCSASVSAASQRPNSAFTLIGTFRRSGGQDPKRVDVYRVDAARLPP